MEVEPARKHSFRINNLIHGANSILSKTNILIVGVGGIGCEILKVLSKSPIGSVHILDMDTIEVLLFLSSYRISTGSSCSNNSTRACQRH